MTKSFLFILSLFFLISCGSGGSDGGSGGSPRENKIQNIVSKGFKGTVPNFDGLYEGNCSGTLEYQGELAPMRDCEFEITITQEANSIKIEPYVFFTYEGESYSYGLSMENLLIAGNSLIESYNYSEVGEIGSIGLQMKGDLGKLRFLKSETDVYYFDGEILEDNGLKITTKANLKAI